MSDIHVFYHLYQVNDWENVYRDQMETMERSGLVDAAASITIGVVGDAGLPCTPKGALVKRHSVNIDVAETMQMLAEFSRENPDTKVCFFHSKGVTGPSPAHTSWRKYLDYWTLTCWQKNVELLCGADCVGTNWRIDCFCGRRPHFSGCFWWANSQFINGLNPEFLTYPDRMLREFWIGSSVFKKPTTVIEIHNSGLNNSDPAQHYFQEYPEHLYMDRINLTVHKAPIDGGVIT
jgi:hypothetical protein